MSQEKTTKTYRLPPGTDILLAVADSVAWALEKKRQQLGIDCDEEALLRVRIAAADFAMNRYLEFAASADKSPQAQMFLAEAKARCYCTLEMLRRRVTRSIAQLCRIMTDEDLEAVAQHVIAVGA